MFKNLQTKNKILIFMLLFYFSFLFLNISHAQNNSKNISGLFIDKLPIVNCGEDLMSCMGNIGFSILQILSALAFILSAILISWAGISYITSGSKKQEDINKIHTMIIWSIIGFIIAVIALGIVNFIKNVIINKNKVFLLNEVFAQTQIQEISPPSQLKCGTESTKSINSIFEGSQSNYQLFIGCIRYYLEQFLIFFINLSLILAAIFFSWAGILYITQPQKTNEIHRRIIYGIIGLVFALLSFSIVIIIRNFFEKI
jgi:membrane protein DedA with SNARE-associated domain